jgi:predicted transcriptional regulator
MTEQGDFDLSADQAAVFQAVSQLESSADGPGHVQQIAAEAHLDEVCVQRALDDLSRMGLVTATTDPWQPEAGPRYQVQSMD